MSNGDDVDYEEWRVHLTPELRAKFEQYGEPLVEMQINDQRFKSVEKRRAGIVWLKDERDKRARTEKARFWWVVLVAAASLVASVVGIAVTAW